MKAMTGTLIGKLVNIILDPIMILGFGWGITGVDGLIWAQPVADVLSLFVIFGMIISKIRKIK